MKKFIVLGLLVSLVVSCDKKEKDYTILAGKIENAEADSVYFVRNDIKKSIPLVNGEFKDTLNLRDNGYFEFYAGRERTQVFLNPGDSLYVTTDMAEFDEALKYGGTSAAENNYLAAKQLKIEKLYADPSAFFGVEPDAFTKNLNELKSGLISDLDNQKVEGNFKELETKNINYFYYTMLDQYPVAYKYFQKKDAVLPEGFDAEINKLDIGNEADFMAVPSYREFVLYKFSKDMNEAKTPEEIEKLIGAIKSPKIKDAVMKDVLLYIIASGGTDSERYNSFVQKNASDEKLKKQAAEAFAKVQNLLPGKPSPKFSYPDNEGKIVSLDDLKGRLVYIDVWATWCGPCIQEIPSLKTLETDYHGKDLAFVSMSIDPQADKAKWLKLIKDKDLKGIQVFAENDWKSKFVQDYGIQGIPRFILIDTNGNIINADAPRPSDPEIRTLIDQHLGS